MPLGTKLIKGRGRTPEVGELFFLFQNHVPLPLYAWKDGRADEALACGLRLEEKG